MSLFSERLKNARCRKKLKQMHIANHLGVSVQSYSAYENGREPNYDILNKLALLLDVDVAYLTGFSDCMKQENQSVSDELGLSETAINVLRSLRNRDKTKCIYRIDKMGWIINDPRDFLSSYLESISEQVFESEAMDGDD